MGGYIRVGQFAEAIRRSPYQVRKLCDARVIESIVIDGQRQIPMAELDRLLKEGVPPIPRIISDQQLHQPRRRRVRAGPLQRRSRHQLHSHPTNALVQSGEEVEITENRAATTEAQIRESLAYLKLLDAKEEIARRQAKRAAEKADLEARQVAAHRRREWAEVWLEHALRMIPEDATEEYAPEVYPQVKSKLINLDPNDPEVIVRIAVESTVRRVLEPWYEQQEQEQDAKDAISEALKELLAEMKAAPWARLSTALVAAHTGRKYSEPQTEWEVKARYAANTAIIEALRNASGMRVTFDRLLPIAKAAVARVVAEFERQRSQR